MKGFSSSLFNVLSCHFMSFPDVVFNVLQGRKVRTKEPPRERPKDPEDSGL